MSTRLGAIGLGGLAYVELNIYNDMDDVELVAGADIAEPARKQFQEKFDTPAYESYETLLDEHASELDAVTIVTPHTLHHEQAMACLDEGLDVFLEKPMVTGTDNAVELVETANKKGRVVQVGYQRHFHPVYREIKELVDEGRIGELHMVNCYLGQDWISGMEGRWRSNPELSGGGQLYDSGSHLLDALLWTTGTTPEQVSALVENYGHDVDVNSALSVRLDRNGNSVIGSIGISADGTSGGDPEEGLFIWGSDGRIAYDGSSLEVTTKTGPTYTTEITENTDFETVTERKLRNFIESAQGEVEPEVPAEVGLEVTALTEAAYQAAETGEVVDVQAEIDAGKTETVAKH